jgi:hypothetical protein
MKSVITLKKWQDLPFKDEAVKTQLEQKHKLIPLLKNLPNTCPEVANLPAGEVKAALKAAKTIQTVCKKILEKHPKAIETAAKTKLITWRVESTEYLDAVQKAFPGNAVPDDVDDAESDDSTAAATSEPIPTVPPPADPPAAPFARTQPSGAKASTVGAIKPALDRSVKTSSAALENMRQLRRGLIPLQEAFIDSQALAPDAGTAARDRVLASMRTIVDRVATQSSHITQSLQAVEAVEKRTRPEDAEAQKALVGVLKMLGALRKKASTIDVEVGALLMKMQDTVANGQLFTVKDYLPEYTLADEEALGALEGMPNELRRVGQQYRDAAGQTPGAIQAIRALLDRMIQGGAATPAEMQQLDQEDQRLSQLAKNFPKWNKGVISDWKTVEGYLERQNLLNDPEVKGAYAKALRAYDDYAAGYSLADEAMKDYFHYLRLARSLNQPLVRDQQAANDYLAGLKEGLAKIRELITDPDGRIANYVSEIPGLRASAQAVPPTEDRETAVQILQAKAANNLEIILANQGALERLPVELRVIREMIAKTADRRPDPAKVRAAIFDLDTTNKAVNAAIQRAAAAVAQMQALMQELR